MRRFNLVKAFFLSLSLTIAVHAPVNAGQQPRAVVELFTSQGCSSCPAADQILANYAQSKDVLALSFHVDYWNYLGWEDTFSKAAFSDRQRRYAVSFQRRQIYTPQAVVNGRNHVVGSRDHDIQDLIHSYDKSGKGLSVRVMMERGKDNVHIFTNENKGNATALLVYYNKKQKVKITRGENRGRTIEYHNVVGHVAMSGMMKEGKFDISLPLAELKRTGYDACAVLLQETSRRDSPGPIVGAIVIDNL